MNYLNSEAEYAAFSAIPRVLKRGIDITNRENHKGRGYNTVTIAAPVTINGKKGIVGAVVKKTKGNRYKTHRIVMPDGTVFVFEKNKTEATTASMTNLKTGEGPAITPVLDNSISAEVAKNNTKYSLSDNQGRQLTKEQQEYFKDSKVRDENGNLLIMYHGTDAEFTTFRTDYRGAIWLSSDRDVASGFDASGNGKTKELYVNITNPLEKEFTLNDNWDIDEVIRGVKNGGYDGAIINFKADNNNSYLKFMAENYPDEPAENFLESVPGHSSTAKEGETISQYMKRATISAYKYFAATSRSQLKNVYNTNPTSNPDLRYSLSDSQGEKITKNEQANNTDKILNEFGLNSVNYYVHVQKKVLETLGNDFFGEVIVENTGMIVDIGKKGIKETFGPGKGFQTLPRELKMCKLAVVKQSPELIKKAQLVEGDVKNLHGKNKTSMFDYLETSTEINGVPCKIKIDIKKSEVKNKFWMHRVEIKNEQNLNLPYNSKGINEVSAHVWSIADEEAKNNSDFLLAPTKDYRIYGKDIKLQNDIAPVNEEVVAKNATAEDVAPVKTDEPEDLNEAEPKGDNSTDKPVRPLLRTEMKSISRSIKRSYGSTFDPTKDIMRLHKAMFLMGETLLDLKQCIK